LRLLLSLMAMPQYPPLRRLGHSLPHSPLLHCLHHSHPQYITWPQLTSIIGSASNASRCAQTWTCQGCFSMAEPSPIEAPVIPHGHASISTPVKTVMPATAPSAIPPPTHPSCTSLALLTPLSPSSHSPCTSRPCTHQIPTLELCIQLYSVFPFIWSNPINWIRCSCNL